MKLIRLNNEPTFSDLMNSFFENDLFGSFSRSFMLPKSIDNEKINAEYKNGVLCLHLPKREEEKTKIKRQIAIS